ncbi:ComF family protein [Brevibacillus humidisoli]|uniref:ComF family protein n=1 Tax=Brevibacillus humidisoli TaxID=2895522 RepID=UPI001E2ECE3D|nr:ComF family protein [Brevibacillus humidisoli]UFJ40064.1 ComF family protein [Brevibacillus humidisoli]
MITGEICQRCGREYVHAQDREPERQAVAHRAAHGTGALCGDCIRWGDKDPLVMNRSTLRYDNWSKEMISLLKYRGDERIAELLAVLLIVSFQLGYAGKTFQLLSYVPLHEQRLLERGFNQAELLAHRVAQHTGMLILPLLQRTKRTAKQSQQEGRQARLESMIDAFRVDPSIAQMAANRLARTSGRTARSVGAPWRVPAIPRLLLIDDIYTTGATIRSCARTLQTHPLLAGIEVHSLTVCR